MPFSYLLQLRNIVSNAQLSLGDVPVLIGEVGVPFDINNRKAFLTGNYEKQAQLMFALVEAVRVLQSSLLRIAHGGCCRWKRTASATRSGTTIRTTPWSTGQLWLIELCETRADPLAAITGSAKTSASTAPPMRKLSTRRTTCRTTSCITAAAVSTRSSCVLPGPV